jgi:tape measure domain-containing protein
MKDQSAIYTIGLRDRFSQGFGRIDRSSSRLERRMGGITKMAGALGLALGASAAVAGVARITKEVAKLGIELEQTRIAFETMLGDRELGNKMIDQLQQFANVTPFTNRQVIQGARQLLAMGVQQENIMASLESLGNIAAGVGTEKLPRLILAFGQVKSASRLTGMELRQFTEAGVPLLELLSNQLGKSVKVIKQDLIPAGEISFEMVRKAIKSSSEEGGRFFRLMEKQSQTAGGRISTLIGKLQLVGMTFGERMTPQIVKTTNKLIELVDIIPQVDFSPLTSSVDSFTSSVGEAFSAVNDLFEVLGGGNTKLEKTNSLVRVMSGVFRGMSFVTRNAWLAIAALIEMISGLSNAMRGFAEIGKGNFKAGFTMIDLAIDVSRDQISDMYSKFYDEEGKFWSDLLGIQRDKTDFELFQEQLDKALDKALEGYEGGKKKKKGTGGLGGGGDITESLSDTISGRSPKSVVMNIDKIIENMTFASTTETDMGKMKDAVTRSLMAALRDAQIITGQQ